MSENYRKEVDEYSQFCMANRKGPTQWVYRPNSMRKVDASKELNRLRDALIQIRAEADRTECTCPRHCLKCEIVGIFK